MLWILYNSRDREVALPRKWCRRGASLKSVILRMETDLGVLAVPALKTMCKTTSSVVWNWGCWTWRSSNLSNSRWCRTTASMRGNPWAGWCNSIYNKNQINNIPRKQLGKPRSHSSPTGYPNFKSLTRQSRTFRHRILRPSSPHYKSSNNQAMPR